MYRLFYSPDACSLATHTVLNLLDQPPQLASVNALDSFAKVNPAKQVPALQCGEEVMCEGAAILLYLLNKHENDLLPANGVQRQHAIENIMFANASMHPAYSRLFFINNLELDQETKLILFNAASEHINHLWQVVEQKLRGNAFLGGESVSAADILLAVYSRWGAYFPVDIPLSERIQAMLKNVFALDAFKLALKNEQADQKKHGY